MASEYPLWVVVNNRGEPFPSTLSSNVNECVKRAECLDPWSTLVSMGYGLRRCRIELEPENDNAQETA